MCDAHTHIPLDSLAVFKPVIAISSCESDDCTGDIILLAKAYLWKVVAWYRTILCVAARILPYGHWSHHSSWQGTTCRSHEPVPAQALLQLRFLQQRHVQMLLDCRALLDEWVVANREPCESCVLIIGSPKAGRVRRPMLPFADILFWNPIVWIAPARRWRSDLERVVRGDQKQRFGFWRMGNTHRLRAHLQRPLQRLGTCYFLRLMSLHVSGQVLKDETFLERIDGPEELPICTCSHILCTALYRFNSLDRKHFTDAVRCCFIFFFPVFWCMLQLCWVARSSYILSWWPWWCSKACVPHFAGTGLRSCGAGCMPPTAPMSKFSAQAQWPHVTMSMQESMPGSGKNEGGVGITVLSNVMQRRCRWTPLSLDQLCRTTSWWSRQHLSQDRGWLHVNVLVAPKTILTLASCYGWYLKQTCVILLVSRTPQA